MEIRQLRYFLAIFEEKHVGRAAKKCFVTQPALTQQIHKLEEELRISLFMPDGRGIAITADGKKFIPYARKIIESVEKAILAFSPDSTIEHQGEVVLGVSNRIHSLLLSILPRLAVLKIRIKKMRHEQMLHEIDSGVISLGIMHSSQEHHSVEKKTILCEKMYFIISDTNQTLPTEQHISIKNVLKTPIILLSDKVLPRVIFDKYIGKVRPRMNLVSELDSIDELMAVIKYSSMGSILLGSQLPENMKGLKKMEIVDNPFNYELSLIWNKEFADKNRINSFISALSEINFIEQCPDYFIPADSLLNS